MNNEDDYLNFEDDSQRKPESKNGDIDTHVDNFTDDLQ